MRYADWIGGVTLSDTQFDQVFNSFSIKVRTDNEYKKLEYTVWRDIRDTLMDTCGTWKIYSFERYIDSPYNNIAFFLVSPNLKIWCFPVTDHSFGSFVWENYTVTNIEDRFLPTIREIPILAEYAEKDGVMLMAGNIGWPAYSKNPTVTTTNNNDNDKEENKIMNFNFDFGPCGDTVKLSMYGIAVKNASGNYVSYDRANGEIIDVDILNFDGGKYCYKIPVAISGIKVGDTVIHAKKPMFVVGINDTNLVVVDVVAGEEKTIIPTKNMFGFNYATKIVSVIDSFGGFSASKDNPFGNMLPLMLLSDNKYGSNSDMLLAMMLMNGNGAMDFTKNPMMLYLLMNKRGSEDIDPFMMMMLMNATGGAPIVNTTSTVTASPSNSTVKLP